MATNDKVVKVTLVAVSTPYVKGINEGVTATNKLGREIDGTGQKVGKASGALKGMAVAGAAVAGTALVAFLKDSVQAAGDLEQSVGGVNAVFGESADKIHEFGKDSADAVGLSTNAFNELVTVTGAMLKNKGLDGFAEKSLELVQIGADLSATFGGTAKDAVEALNAAMRGESDPIERYGISLNEAAVKAELAATGADKFTGAALEQAKAQARIDIIMRQSTDAMGAFGREADTLQGQQQRLSAEWENAQASLGQALLPAMTSAFEALRGGVDLVVAAAGAWERLPGPVKAAAAALIALHVLRGPLAGMLDGTITKVKTLGTTLKGGGIAGGAKAAGSALMGAFGGPLGIAVGIGAAALMHFWQEAEKVNTIADTLRGTIDKTSGSFTNLSREAVVDSLMGDLSAEDIKLVESLGFKFEDVARAALAGGDASDEMRKKISAASQDAYIAGGIFSDEGQALEGLGRSFGRAAEGAERARVVEDVKASIKETGDEAGKAAPKVDVLAGKTDELRTASEEAAELTRDLAKAILEVSDAAVSADQAEADWQAAIDAVTAALDENGKTATKNKQALDLTTEAGRNNQAALIDLRDAALENAEAMLNQGDSVDSVKGKMKDARAEFIESATKMGLSKDAAKKMADEYGLTEGKVDNLKEAMDAIPKKVVSELKADTAQAKKDIAALQRQIDLLKGKTITITTKFGTVRASGVNSTGQFGRGFLEGGFAAGGHVTGPGTPTSDSIPAWLSDGEYVVKAAAVDKYGKHFFDRLNSMRFADGGHVSRMSSPAVTSGGIDYNLLAAAVTGSMPPMVSVQSGLDATNAARAAIRDYEWRIANG